MIGYRNGESDFDPNVVESYGRPLRPFDAVQWTGVVLIVSGIVFGFLFLASFLGLIALDVRSGFPFIAMPSLGLLLVFSRRQPAPDEDSLQIARNRRNLLFTLAGVLLVLGLAGVLVAIGVAP